MKNFIFFIAILTVSTFSVKDANANPLLADKAYSFTDSTEYLRTNLINKKAKFLHQPLSVLLKASKLKIKSYIVGSGWKGPNDKTPVTIVLFFQDPIFVSKNIGKGKVLPSIVISFDISPPKREARSLCATNHGRWLEDEEKFYGSATVKDIVLVGDKKY